MSNISLISKVAALINDSGMPIKGWQRNLLAYKERHLGKKCVLIGNGPSVRLADLNQINQQDCITFVFNRFHKIYSELDFQPDYTVAIDPAFINDFADELQHQHRGELFIGHHKIFNLDVKFNWFRVKSNQNFEFSNNPIKYIEPGGSVVIAAMQLAYYMGINEFYLYGLDHNFTFSPNEKQGNDNRDNLMVVGEGNHFIDNYRSNKAWIPPDMALIEEAFVKSKQFLELNKRKIVNISRKSNLSVIPALNFESFLETFN